MALGMCCRLGAMLLPAAMAIKISGSDASTGIVELVEDSATVGSQGCFLEDTDMYRRPKVHTDTLMHMQMSWSEPGLPDVNRSYGIAIPGTYNGTEPLPLVFVFHGWGEGTEYYEAYDFGTLSSQKGFVAVFPVGMSDCNTPDCKRYTSWNGAGTSNSSDDKMSCDKSVQTYDYCYTSCISKKGSCHPCDWTTCYDDVGFIRKLVQEVTKNLCINRRRIHAHGCSNGGMFVHELAQNMPGVFAGIASSCGGKPHRGWVDRLPQGGPPISMAIITGKRDNTIPRNGSARGTKNWDGFLYATDKQVGEVYYRYNKCRNGRQRRYGAGFNAKNMTCHETGYDCEGNSSVATCWFKGPHDFNLGTGNNSVADGPEFSWRFFHEHPLDAKYLHVAKELLKGSFHEPAVHVTWSSSDQRH